MSSRVPTKGITDAPPGSPAVHALWEVDLDSAFPIAATRRTRVTTTSSKHRSRRRDWLSSIAGVVPDGRVP
jgi:hypothetical protein